MSKDLEIIKKEIKNQNFGNAKHQIDWLVRDMQEEWYNKTNTCKTCKGWGEYEDYGKTWECTKCKGTGKNNENANEQHNIKTR